MVTTEIPVVTIKVTLGDDRGEEYPYQITMQTPYGPEWSLQYAGEEGINALLEALGLTREEVCQLSKRTSWPPQEFFIIRKTGEQLFVARIL